MATENDVRVLSQLKGMIYTTMRDELFRRGGTYSDLIARYGEDPDWRVGMTAAILQGWFEHHDLYRKVLTEINQIDPAARGRTLTGVVGIWEEYVMRAHVEYGSPILPLAWEGAVKYADTAPAWRTATFLAMIAGVPLKASRSGDSPQCSAYSP